MTIIGTLATLLGTAVTVYGLWYPAELTGRVNEILQTMGSLAPLPDPDQFMVLGIVCPLETGDCTAIGMKGITRDNAQIKFSACTTDGHEIASASAWIPKAGGNYDIGYPASDDVVMLTNVKMGTQTFTVLEHWKTVRDEGRPAENHRDDYRLTAPEIRSGDIDCQNIGAN